MKLIAGLGNPGPSYIGTPHNLGYEVAERLASRLGVRLRESSETQGLVGCGQLAGEEVIVIKPTTFMNLSGAAVALLAHGHRLRPEDVFVLVDDVDLPLGTLRWRRKGGDGGHKGLRSVIEELESDGFPRLRIGVQPQERPDDVESYVLTAFAEDEREWVEKIAEAAAASVLLAVAHGVETAANRFNGASIASPRKKVLTIEEE
ncbi:MAG: aminoacyl-tRNA hydrolase [Candidatus Sumerlaeota bacterium]|nr:aminoacyl-tRNA hydrolase [Candidatus Sumerlaeota bacterium]